ncbi:hypothetical protein OIU34_17130 [Pararhizobium sp. BT-229]|uniref:hypothetical protein n=1 Tax=Pararhizobium sp. BT-229 TaxID=2986923 RepID=UPI0021F71932|nr:hypothetical protein [Pararhizobium sp. BT-229]MCV9963625.1 hypothetical protein [Pararhizobium sp. BT-229]
MGRWIDWRVSEELTAAEVEALAAVINGTLRDALPLVAKQISDDRPKAPSLMTRLSYQYTDRVTAEYAADPETVVVTDGEVRVAGSGNRRSLNFQVVAGDYSGHTIGFQDYASIGVLAAASQVSGKIVLTGGDELAADYVDHVLARFEKAGAELRPEANFAASLEREANDEAGGASY